MLDEESYVCVGRAADFVLKDKPNVLTVYIDAPYEDRIEREMKRQGIGRSQAMHYIDKLDHYRESYYKYHTGRQWKRVENYDLCLDSAAIGLDLSLIHIFHCWHRTWRAPRPAACLRRGWAPRKCPARKSMRSARPTARTR